MVAASQVIYYLLHTSELKSIIQWQTWHDAPHIRDEEKESASLKECYRFLDMTSRSFSTVIQELHPELLVPVALFYLILRGLDTIEDDMTIPLQKKDPILRDFHAIIEREGWNFDGSGPEEKDRELLVKFNVVIEEIMKIKPEYRTIIKDITKKMGHGMAVYCKKAEENNSGPQTVREYDQYCHYVAGLVGEGLTRMFVESKLANPILLDRAHLQESMGLFLQKTNIIRDVKEDFDDNRKFWPKEIWSKHVDNFEDLFKPENLEKALNCSSEMVLDALAHADECLFYLAGLREQSVFNFAAIPQAIAIATLDLVFRNPKVFRTNVKITKGQACRIMLDSTQSLSKVCDTFRMYARSIHKKNTPKDPNFLKISIACGKIEQFIESIFPSQSAEAVIRKQKSQPEPDAAAASEAKWDTIYMLAFLVGFLIIIAVLMIGVAIMFGARFDAAFAELKENFLSLSAPSAVEAVKESYNHGEL